MCKTVCRWQPLQLCLGYWDIEIDRCRRLIYGARNLFAISLIFLISHLNTYHTLPHKLTGLGIN